MESYPLEDNWDLKFRQYIDYNKGQSRLAWKEAYKLLYKIEDLIIFWQVFNNIKYEKTCYSLFKNGIDAEWEHPENTNGFSLIYYKETDKDMEELVIDIIVKILSCDIPCYKDINGITFDLVKHKLSIWFKIKNNINTITDITKYLNLAYTKVEDHSVSESYNLGRVKKIQPKRYRKNNRRGGYNRNNNDK